MSTISSGTTTTTGYVVTSDTTGTLVFQVNGTTTAATLSATGNLTLNTGNLTFGGTAQRITGDMSNATVANRVSFQTSTASSNTLIPILNTQASNGASVFQFYNNNDTTNNSFAQIGIGGSALQIVSEKNGTGSYFPIVMFTGGSERFRIGTAGQLGVAGANYGNSGQVLTSNGSGAAPSWQAAASGAQDYIVQSYGIV
jgi:hypothetical protein